MDSLYGYRGVRALLREDTREKLDLSFVCVPGTGRDYNKLHTHPSRNTRQVPFVHLDTAGRREGGGREEEGDEGREGKKIPVRDTVFPAIVPALLRLAQKGATFHNGLVFLTFSAIDY